MAVFLDSAVNKSLGATGTWTDIDLSADIAASATGAIFSVRNETDTYDKKFGLRKKGSSDDRYGDVEGGSQEFFIIGVDANRKCQGKIETTDVDFWLVGYTESDAVMLTDGVDKSLTAYNAWTDIDLSVNLPAGAVAAIFEVRNESTSSVMFGLRKKGSTDDFYEDIFAERGLCYIVGVDANRKCQGKAEGSPLDFYLIGYLTMGTAETNAIDRSLGTTDSYVDITESNAPAGSTGVFVRGKSTSIGYTYAARKNGTSGDVYKKSPARQYGIIVGIDDTKKWEGKIASTVIDFFSLYYFSRAVLEKSSSDVGIGADTETELSSSRSESDLGAGADSMSGIQATVVNTDIGAGADATLEQLAAVLGSDAGAGADATLEQLAAVLGSDAGAGADATLEQLAAVLGSDAGVGIGAILESMSARVKSEAGLGVDLLVSILKKVAKYSSDAGIGVGAVSTVLAALAKSDQGAGVDVLLSRLLSFSDVGAGVGAILESMSTRLESEAGVGVDLLVGILKEAAKYSSDAGIGVGAVSTVLAALGKNDQGAGVDVLLSRLLSSSDVGTGLDVLLGLLAALKNSDVGAGADSWEALLASVESSDLGVGAEAGIKVIWIYLLLKLLQAKKISMKLSSEKLLSMDLTHEKLLSMDLTHEKLLIMKLSQR